MPVEPNTPTPKRITPERMAALVAWYQRVQGLGPSPGYAGWTFAVRVVPGLSHQGNPAWAVVRPRVDAAGKLIRDAQGRPHADVSIRDLDATPIPGFDGDAMLEIRVTVSHELFHCAVAEAADAGWTIPAEERLVEAAAQAVVKSEGVDARVMARSVRGVGDALRARVAAKVSALAPAARGGTMDPKMIMEALEALIGGNAEKCQEILKGLIASAAGGGAAPAGNMPPADAVAKIEPPAPVGEAPPEMAARAKGAEMDMARARVAALSGEMEAIVAASRPAAKAALVVGLRARLGPAMTPALEKRIMAAATYPEAQQLAALVEDMAPSAEALRARSGVEHGSNPPPPAPAALPSTEALRAEGFTDSQLVGYAGAVRQGADFAGIFLEQTRPAVRARLAAKTGGAS